jgi:hypothetical protein
VFKDITNRGYRGPLNPFIPKNPTGIQVHEESQIEALVLDVVVNDKHPEYAMDGYNVGAIKFRTLKTDVFRDDSTLNWAFPLEANISDYPLLEEIVLVFQAMNRFYYTRKLNLSNKPTIHVLPGLAQEISPPLTSQDKTKAFRQSVAIPHKDVGETQTSGRYKEPTAVRKLRHDEGDIVFEGRSGQSIRMGASWKANSNFKALETDQSPNILLRVGQDPHAPTSVKGPYGLVVEDINKDASSIYISSDQVVPLKFATESNRAHKASVKDFPSRLTGNQIVINSNRIVLNAKTDKILGNSAAGIHFTTNADFTVDAGKNYKSSIFGDYDVRITGVTDWAGSQQVSIRGTQLFLNTPNSRTHPIVLGDFLAEFLGRFIDAHIQNSGAHVMTAVGPGALSPAVVAALTQLRQDVARAAHSSFNSTTIFGN